MHPDKVAARLASLAKLAAATRPRKKPNGKRAVTVANPSLRKKAALSPAARRQLQAATSHKSIR